MSDEEPIIPARGATYRIDTERLCLRPWEPRDAEGLNRVLRESRGEWMPWADEEKSLDERLLQIRRWRAKFDGDVDQLFGVFERDDEPLPRRIVGGCGLHARIGRGAREIGYWVHPAHQRRGYATELTAALTRVGFELHELVRIEIQIIDGNEASMGIPRKLGYTHEATLRRRIEDRGEWRDSQVWTLLAEDYPRTPCAEADVRAYDALGRMLLGAT